MKIDNNSTTASREDRPRYSRRLFCKYSAWLREDVLAHSDLAQTARRSKFWVSKTMASVRPLANAERRPPDKDRSIGLGSSRRPRRRASFLRAKPGRHSHAARRYQAHYPARLAAHKSYRRLHLDADEWRGSQAIAARNFYPRRLITYVLESWTDRISPMRRMVAMADTTAIPTSDRVKEQA